MPVDSYSPDHSKRLLRLAILLTTAAATALLLLPQTRALAGEVHFDASSPAGKEYALPLDQAREEAAGAGKTDGPAGEKAPLFGEGISGGGGGGGANGGGGGHGGNPASAAGEGHAAGSHPDRGPAVVAAAIASSNDGYALSSAVLWIAAIVALAGLAALALRTLQRPRAS